MGIVAVGVFGSGFYLLSNPSISPSPYEYSITQRSSLSIKSNRISKSTTSSDIVSSTLSKEWSLDDIASHIISGGPPQDGIPPIENPQYVPISHMNNFLDDDDVVFLVESSNPVKIFPQRIMVWHEIVNDEINGEKMSVTYCPLAGSVIGFNGRIGDIETSFGTSGKLVNNNLVMYDRATGSYWPQILGTAVSGDLKGKNLERFPVIWTRWKHVKSKYPNGLVLSQNTGHKRSYDKDPYGSYLQNGNYYDSGGVMFPLMATDDRFPTKKTVIGIKKEKATLAVTKDTFADLKVANLFIDDTPIVIFYDEALDTIRPYIREIKRDVLEFESRGGKFTANGSEWTVRGEPVDDTLQGVNLKPIDSFDVMWFGWASFYPNTKVYPE
jgi:hypothetical protein